MTQRDLPQATHTKHTTHAKHTICKCSFTYLLLILLSFAITIIHPSIALSETETEAQWRRFHNDPKAFINRVPPKRDAGGHQFEKPLSRFPADMVKSGAFIDAKHTFRKGKDHLNQNIGPEICNRKGVCFSDSFAKRARSPQGVTELLDRRELKANHGRVLMRLDVMEQKKLKRASLEETPWSDSFWPIARGILGNRYHSPGFQNSSSTWTDYFAFISDSGDSLFSIYKRSDPQELQDLSPSEKYDLLIGTLAHERHIYEQGYLTPFMWEQGRPYLDADGQVEGWMGICHGWAAAAIMLPRPNHAITLKGADGRTALKFYPSDIKGLASYIWANTETNTRFLGGRCDAKDVRRDPETDRILDEQCFDVNPGDWHIAVVNQIAIAKRSFVMDATFDYEVWNQPVYGYDYVYINPENGYETQDFKAALIPIEEYGKDKFKRFRSPAAKFVIGISMDLTYVVENRPSHAESDSPDNDVTATVRYMYDLELDQDYKIIGGEWYYNRHPDFLWLPDVDSRALSPGDLSLKDAQETIWDVNKPLPQFWADIAIATATRTGLPVATIIENMISAARSTQ